MFDFSEEEGLLIATSKRPLIVINKALGYRIYIELVTFKWPINMYQGGLYLIYPKFELLSPSNEDQRHTWKTNRIKNYAGSLSHFLKSLYNDTLDNDGFSIRRSRNLISLTWGEVRYALLSIFGFSKQRQKNIRGFKLHRLIDVVFDKTVTYRFNNQQHTLSVEKKSSVKANSQDDTFFIDSYGSLLVPTSLTVYGRWSNDRVASSLPLNYSLGN